MVVDCLSCLPVIPPIGVDDDDDDDDDDEEPDFFFRDSEGDGCCWVILRARSTYMACILHAKTMYEIQG